MALTLYALSVMVETRKEEVGFSQEDGAGNSATARHRFGHLGGGRGDGHGIVVAVDVGLKADGRGRYARRRLEIPGMAGMWPVGSCAVELALTTVVSILMLMVVAVVVLVGGMMGVAVAAVAVDVPDAASVVVAANSDAGG